MIGLGESVSPNLCYCDMRSLLATSAENFRTLKMELGKVMISRFFLGKFQRLGGTLDLQQPSCYQLECEANSKDGRLERWKEPESLMSTFSC